MAMIASGSHHFQMMCSGPSPTGYPRLKEPALSPAQVSLRESARGNSSIVNDQSPSPSPAHPAPESATLSLAFVYGTLKRGFGNHWLMEEQMGTKHCRLVGTGRTKHKYPLVCGPFQVPFLLDVCGSGEHVLGELYQVDAHCLGLLDELEGVSKGHYLRCPLTLTGLELHPSFDADALSLSRQQGHQISNLGGDVQVEAYFAAHHLTPGLYGAAPNIEAYTEKESATYIRRIHRPQDRTFLEHVYHWIDEKKRQTNCSTVVVESHCANEIVLES